MNDVSNQGLDLQIMILRLMLRTQQPFLGSATPSCGNSGHDNSGGTWPRYLQRSWIYGFKLSKIKVIVMDDRLNPGLD